MSEHLYPCPVETRRALFKMGVGLAAAATAYAASTSASEAAGRHSDPNYCEPLCLLEGTSVLTTRGSVPVEDLKVGDKVITVCGDRKKVVWVGSQSYSRAEGEAWADSVDPVFVEASAIGEAMPARGVFVSPKHALYIDGYFVPAHYLINGRSIRQGAFEGSEIRYYHFRCEEHEAVLADGLPVETLQWKLDVMSLAMDERATGPEMLEPYAPVLGYWNKKDETVALVRRITSKCVDIRDPLQVIYDRIFQRADAMVSA